MMRTLTPPLRRRQALPVHEELMRFYVAQVAAGMSVTEEPARQRAWPALSLQGAAG